MSKSSTVQSRFEAASEFVRNGGLESASVGADEMRQLSLTLYGLFKQATTGKCNTPQPSYFDFVGRKKWQAWSDLENLSSNDAMVKYVEIVSKRAPSFATVIGSPRTSQSLPGTSISNTTLGTTPDEVHNAYLMTGITGFIGIRLAGTLLQRNPQCKVYALARQKPEAFTQMMSKKFGEAAAKRIIQVQGDITQPNLGLDARERANLKANGVTSFYHLAALYDLNADDDANNALNINGTSYAVDVANELGVTFHYVSSIVVAGDYKGTFYENMYDAGQTHSEPYYKTKFVAEGIVRQKCKVPTRIYRPGIVIGSSVDGVADKIDGPYYLFKTIQQLRKYSLEWMVFPFFRGETLPLVPVDYVVKSMDKISHRSEGNGKTFHLVDPEPQSFLEVMNAFCRAAHAPQFSSRVIDILVGLVPDAVHTLETKFPNIYKTPFDMFAKFANIPAGALRFVFNGTVFDDTETESVLTKTNSGIVCPPLESYAFKVWDHWERYMDPELDKRGALAKAVKGKTAVVTGGHSGIGRAIVDQLLQAGVKKCILVGRDVSAMEQVQTELQTQGYVDKVYYYKCDLSQEAEATSLPAKLLEDHKRIDILVNNAGRSIRRSVAYQYDRLHDFRRTIDLNFFGSLALILGLLPKMRELKCGNIINISSIGAQTNQPRFSAYAASKAALDTFSRCINSEIAQDNVLCSTIYMPLVKTKMIAPTSTQKKSGVNYYNRVAITPEQAATMSLKPLYTNARTVATTLGNVLQMLYWISPALVDQIFSVVYKLEPEQAPEGKIATTDENLAKESLAILHMSRELMR